MLLCTENIQLAHQIHCSQKRDNKVNPFPKHVAWALVPIGKMVDKWLKHWSSQLSHSRNGETEAEGRRVRGGLVVTVKSCISLLPVPACYWAVLTQGQPFRFPRNPILNLQAWKAFQGTLPHVIEYAQSDPHFTYLVSNQGQGNVRTVPSY